MWSWADQGVVVFGVSGKRTTNLELENILHAVKFLFVSAAELRLASDRYAKTLARAIGPCCRSGRRQGARREGRCVQAVVLPKDADVGCWWLARTDSRRGGRRRRNVMQRPLTWR